ncbi:hypothetical protein ACFQZ4_37860 [Catellatospora coxensis]|uniref:Uncharacterized protein n=1 Tax=Catellatospora coxensis TaxID=310354 RepID=A0A8J3P4T0_9ACTN|nr:hypothetical protein [Catellatospora coxensis]GIG03662.1 hypothetical protein Cco03nite_03620 [Catellatospora coxensis]
MEASTLLSVLCRELPRLRAVADDTGDRAALERVVKAARRGKPVLGQLRELGLLQVLMDWQTRTGTGHGMVGVPGVGSGHVPRGSFQCPTGTCHRAELSRPGDDRPVCALHSTPLRFG